MNITTRTLLRAAGFHFDSICRSDPTANKNSVTLVLHGPDDQDSTTGSWLQSHISLAGATINALWTYVDYRRNRAVFQSKQDSSLRPLTAPARSMAAVDAPGGSFQKWLVTT